MITSDYFLSIPYTDLLSAQPTLALSHACLYAVGLRLSLLTSTLDLLDHRLIIIIRKLMFGSVSRKTPIYLFFWFKDDDDTKDS